MSQQPFYLIAHRCNSSDKVEEALIKGANAIECDLRYNDQRNVIVVNHDVSLFYERDNLAAYLDKVKELANIHNHLSLLIFDCKFDNPNVAPQLLNTIRERLTNHININILISVATYDEGGFFERIIGKLESREGIAIDYHNKPNEVSSYFEGRGVNNFFYGNGIFAEAVGPNVFPSIAEAIRLKASHKKIKQVYVWTLNAEDSIIKYLRMGVDGIFVDNPDIENLKSILNNQFGDLRRLATREEDAFNPPSLTGQAIFKIDVHTGDKSGAGTDANVYVTLYGEGGEVHTGALNPLIKGNAFERKNVDTVTLNLKDVGTIQKIKVWHDNKYAGFGAPWFLEKIVVTNLTQQQKFELPCNAWLEGSNNARDLNAQQVVFS